MNDLKDKILERLSRVRGPDLTGDIVSLGLVSELFINDGKVIFSITVPADKADDLDPLRQAAEKVVSDIDEVTSVMVALTAEKSASQSLETAPIPAAPKSDQATDKKQVKDDGAAPVKAPEKPAVQPQTPPAKPGIPGIDKIIAVASGKGGVGKSTTAVNLALGLADMGLSVGILDADIYGPSMPRLLGITGKPKLLEGSDNILQPMEKYGIKVMSIGFLIEEDTPMIWRGPMVTSALNQMMREVAWGSLDVLVVDMPPGTGDAQLTMAQQVPLAGAVVVSTPQDLALIDARKGLNMFKKTDVPVLGIIENMSYYMCPKCGHRSEVFGHGGAEQEATKLAVRFLGSIPLHITIRERSDSGEPVVVSEPDSAHTRIYKRIAETVWNRLNNSSRPAPNIVFETESDR